MVFLKEVPEFLCYFLLQGLEHAIAGTGLYVVGPDDDLDDVEFSHEQDW